METINIIARMHSDFATKFGIPRQSGLVEELRSTIVFEPEYRNADALRETVKFIPNDRLLVETDSPYLAPVPFRGQTNRPVNVRTTADFIAALRGLSTVDFAALTTANAKRCFPVLAEGEP
jgi:hypothetical protein